MARSLRACFTAACSACWPRPSGTACCRVASSAARLSGRVLPRPDRPSCSRSSLARSAAKALLKPCPPMHACSFTTVRHVTLVLSPNRVIAVFSAATALCRARQSNWERYAARDSLPILAIRLTVGCSLGLGFQHGARRERRAKERLTLDFRSGPPGFSRFCHGEMEKVQKSKRQTRRRKQQIFEKALGVGSEHYNDSCRIVPATRISSSTFFFTRRTKVLGSFIPHFT